MSKTNKCHSGWMFKKGKRIRSWKQRWFELYEDRLEYYEVENAEKPINTIVLSKGSKLEVLHDEEAPHVHTFQLQTNERTWIFSVETSNDREVWMSQIRNNLPHHSTPSSRSVMTSISPREESLVGYLHKTGKWNTAWRRRWCKLITKEKQLLYYEVVDTKQTFKDKIDLNKVTEIEKESTKNHPNGFALITPGRRYRFSADKPEDLERWFKGISPCIGGKKEKRLRDKQDLLHMLLQVPEFPMGKSTLGNIALPDWLWHEVVDLLGNNDTLDEDVDLMGNNDTLERQEHKVDDLVDNAYHPGLVMHLMHNTTTLSSEAAIRLLKDAKESFLAEPLLLDIQGPVYVIGELYGDLDGLMNIFESLGAPPKAKYLFLGNIIGTVTQSLGVALLLFALKVYYPKHLFIIRGRMEDQIQTRDPRGSIYDECLMQFPREGRGVWKEFVWVFDHMPICAVVNKTFFAVSSGLSKNINKIHALRTGKIRPLYIARTNSKKYKPGRLIGSVIVRDFLYNVPSMAVKRYKEISKESDRGLVLYQFGEMALNTFLQVNKFSHIIRSGPIDESEEVFRVGHATFAENKLISLCSSANFNAAELKSKSVKGAVMFLDLEGQNFTFHSFKPDV